MPTHYIVADLVKVYKEPKKSQKNFFIVLAWGDKIELKKKMKIHGNTIVAENNHAYN